MVLSSFILTGLLRSYRTRKIAYTSGWLIARCIPCKVHHKLVLTSLGELHSLGLECYAVVLCRNYFCATPKSYVILISFSLQYVKALRNLKIDA